MKRTLVTGIVIGVLMVVAWSALRATFPPATAHAAEAAQSGTGRFQMVMSPLLARDVFLVDTTTGRVWQRTQFTDVKGEPEVWEFMEKFDTRSQIDDWLKYQEMKPSEAPSQ
jgi:hypothetical protein